MSKQYYFLVTFALLVYFTANAKDNLKTKSSARFVLQDTSYCPVKYIVQGLSHEFSMDNRGVIGRQACGDTICWNRWFIDEMYNIQIFGGGPWIGAIIDTSTSGVPHRVKAVTTAYEGYGFGRAQLSETSSCDSFYKTSINYNNGCNRHYIDDDGDGKVDEDELDGLDNDSDGKIDEDYGAISENDIYVSYTDTLNSSPIPEHIPLGVKVFQQSFAWKEKFKNPIFPFRYYFINIGNKILDSVYFGIFVDADVGPKNVPNYYSHDNAGVLLEDHRTAYINYIYDYTRVGVTGLRASHGAAILSYKPIFFDIQLSPRNDQEKYNALVRGILDMTEPLYADYRILLSFGPLSRMNPGDIIVVDIAIELGDTHSDLVSNAYIAMEFFKRGYVLPTIPPSPPLRITKGQNRVTLNWQWQQGDSGIDPMETWDDSNKLLESLPDTHWRRRDPPLGHIHGGRVFEAYRVYRCENLFPGNKSWAMLKQFDVKDDLGFEYDTGIEYSYTDSNIIRGREYWYAVTSVSIPTFWGEFVDSLRTGTLESNIEDNATNIVFPYGPSNTLGEAKVVPNPYRGDQLYTDGRGYEGKGTNWSEYERTIWFIDLPSYATIRIFTIAGEIITTLIHDDAARQAHGFPVGQEEWKLFSESGRAIASGIYIYTVESSLGLQTGKFVIIK